MASLMQFTIGADVICDEGVLGTVSRVIIDPVAKAVTHLVIEPKHRIGLGRLVPLDIVDSSNGKIRIHCTTAEFELLEPAEETEFLPGTNNTLGYERDQTWAMPYYGLGLGGLGGAGIGGVGASNVVQPVTHDTIPLGEIAIRRGEQVHATDGDIGKVQGLVIDPRNHQVAHVLLQEGHLWGRKEVAIPISAVLSVDNGVRLSITKGEIEALPPVDIDDPDAV